MKLVLDKKKEENKFSFGNVSIGQPFKHEGEIFLKIDDTFSTYNAMNMTDYELFVMHNDLEVDEIYSKNSEFRVYSVDINDTN